MAKHSHGGHRQRVKERCRREGLDGFAEHEVLEYLLYFTIPQKNTNDTAHLLLEEFCSLAQVLDASYEDLLQVKGIGEHTAGFLSSLPDVFRAYEKSRWGERIQLTDTQMVADYLRSLFIGETNEVFYVLSLDAQNRLICASRLSEGDCSGVSVYASTVVKEAIKHNARGVVLAHNHPGASPRPTSYDLELTRGVENVLRNIYVTVQDHVIVAGLQYFSFAENEYLQNIEV